MEVITIQSDAFQQIISKLDSLEANVKHIARQQPLSEPWLDIAETCSLLNVSKRTLQTYRDNGTLSFSKIGGKIYFNATDVEEHLKKHYKKAFRKDK